VGLQFNRVCDTLQLRIRGVEPQIVVQLCRCYSGYRDAKPNRLATSIPRHAINASVPRMISLFARVASELLWNNTH
jgi:hypothetical protein